MHAKVLDLCLVIPVYNEQECISDVLRDWQKTLGHIDINYKVIAINDGSTDETGEYLDQFARQWNQLEVLHQKNSGHGKSILNGYQKALSNYPNWVFQVDSDNQFFAEDFLKIWKLRQETPFIIGHRENRKDGLTRKMISAIVAFILDYHFGVRVKDGNSPFRLMRSDVLRNLLSIIPHGVFAPNIFLSLMAAKNNLYCTTGVRHKPRKTGKVSIVQFSLLKVCLRSFKELWSFKFTIDDRLKRLQQIQDSDPLSAAS